MDGAWGRGGKAYYPSSSALVYLNANDVRERGERDGGRERQISRKRDHGGMRERERVVCIYIY